MTDSHPQVENSTQAPRNRADSKTTATAARRKKFWDLPAKFHCPVVGTCLTLDELRRLARKAGIEAHGSDYELHHGFVQLVGERGYPARILQKSLERKFAATVKRSSACSNARALGDFWQFALKHGEAPGAFWAVLTHPLSDAGFIERVYGEVHMRSHIAGHARAAAEQQMPRQQQRLARLEAALARASAAMRDKSKAGERNAAALSRQLQRSARLEHELAAAKARIAELEGGALLASLLQENAALTESLRQSTQRALAAESALHRARRQLAMPAYAQKPAADVCADTPPSAPPTAVAQCAPACAEASAGDCPGPDLCGRRILYVGGRERQVMHFRALVARRNGELLHHDGGRHERHAHLDALVRAADAVLCPVECVSHDACRRIKRLCKREQKPFIPLRSASLSNFAEGLRVIPPARSARTSTAMNDGR